MTRWFAAFAALCMLSGAAACTEDAGEPDPAHYLSGIVYIAVNSDLPGWSEYNHGVWDGFDIALANWLGREIGFQPRFVPVTTNERKTVLAGGTAEGQIKLVIANFSITDDRRAQLDFAGPYMTDAQGVLTLKTGRINKREDLENKNICTALGSTNENRLDDMKIVSQPENTLKQCVEQLRAGKSDGMSSDQVLLDGFVAHDSQGDLRVVQSIRFGSERYGIGLPNNRPKLCAFLSDKLKKFIDEQWDQVFRDKLPGISAEGRKPNSGVLDPCEQPA